MPIYGPQINKAGLMLLRAKQYLKKGWCKGNQAVDAAGYSVDPSDPKAVAWCAYGALLAAGMPEGGRHPDPAVTLLLAAIGDGSRGPAPFNNKQTEVARVLAVFDVAITSTIR